MKTVILLHSTTGNTKLVARYAAGWLTTHGHECVVHDIVKRGHDIDLTDVDLLGVACPTMYFRPTQAMEKFIVNMPATAGRPRPAFLLATAGGEPGSHFVILSDLLALKGYVTLDACWFAFPDNWPPHRAPVEPLTLLEPLAALAGRRFQKAVPLLALAWPDLGVPGPDDPPKLRRFLERIVQRAATADLTRPPSPEVFHKAIKSLALMGRVMTRQQMEQFTAIGIDSRRCSTCGTCVKVCPSGTITRASDDEVPSVGVGCTGCWACFNHCPEAAISGWRTPHGRGQYRGPAADIRALFTPPKTA
jgi:NAD-dependent dihydropyrimidine dehydrogenase PreA subunit